MNLNTSSIRGSNAWHSPEQLKRLAGRSREVADGDFPDEVRWIRSYVIAEADGILGSVCIYQARDPNAIRTHAQRVGMPADEIWNIAELVVIRRDPPPQAHKPPLAATSGPLRATST
jgi:hypothetical protein